MILEELLKGQSQGFKARMSRQSLHVEAYNEQDLKQARGFWNVVEKSGFAGDYLKEVKPVFPLRAVLWQGSDIPGDIDDKLLSCGFNALVTQEPCNTRLVNLKFHQSSVSLDPSLSLTTKERLLSDINDLKGPCLYCLPKNLNPEWFWEIIEDIPSNKILVFHGDDQAFWQALRKEVNSSLTPIMPLLTRPEQIHLLSRCYRHRFLGAIVALSEWPEDEKALWVAGFSQWWSGDPKLLLEAWKP